MKLALVKYSLVVAALLGTGSVSADCRIQWPVDSLQLLALTNAVRKANPGAIVTNTEIVAPGLATVSYKDIKSRSQKVALSYEFRSTDCVGDDANAADELLRNPLLFRVLSYTPMPLADK